MRRLNASDGLPARVSGPWSRSKLRFLEYYLPVALTITKRFPQRRFLDLFAGPGRNIIEDTNEEFEGSPILAVRTEAITVPRTRFSHADLVNFLSDDFGALETRLEKLYGEGEGRIPRACVKHYRGDTNQLLDGIMNSIPASSYVFAFADIEAPSDWPWTSVERLRRDHRALDLYVLCPVDMGIVRLAPYSSTERKRLAPFLTPFFGTDEWEPIVERLRKSDAQRRELRAELVRFYLDRLRTLWAHAGSVIVARRPTGQTLYEMFFASGADVADKLAQSARKAMGREDYKGQFGLDLPS